MLDDVGADVYCRTYISYNSDFVNVCTCTKKPFFFLVGLFLKCADPCTVHYIPIGTAFRYEMFNERVTPARNLEDVETGMIKKASYAGADFVSSGGTR